MKRCKMKDYKTKSDTLGRVTTLIVYKLHSIFLSQIIEYLLQSSGLLKTRDLLRLRCQNSVPSVYNSHSI